MSAKPGPTTQLVCAHCENPFIVPLKKQNRHKFCSGVCRRLHSQKVPRSCLRCGQIFLVHPYRAEAAKYCSMDCSQRGLIWNKIDTSGGPDACWEFQGSRTDKGYGKKIRNGGYTSVHRFIYAETYGPIPEGMQINHKCNNPPCCNPQHLYAGTQSENIADAIRSNRYKTIYKQGELHPNAKLDEEKVRAIRQLKGLLTGRAIAKQFEISPGTVSSILNGHHWCHVM